MLSAVRLRRRRDEVRDPENGMNGEPDVTKKAIITPSILAADFGQLYAEVEAIDAGAD